MPRDATPFKLGKGEHIETRRRKKHAASARLWLGEMWPSRFGALGACCFTEGLSKEEKCIKERRKGRGRARERARREFSTADHRLRLASRENPSIMLPYLSHMACPRCPAAPHPVLGPFKAPFQPPSSPLSQRDSRERERQRDVAPRHVLTRARTLQALLACWLPFQAVRLRIACLPAGQ